MKRIIIFLGLKVREIYLPAILIGIVLYGVISLTWAPEALAISRWHWIGIISGIMVYVFLFVIFIYIIITVLIPDIINWIKANWKKAGEIAGREK